MQPSNTSTKKANEEFPTMGDMLIDEDYTALCQEVERQNMTGLMFTPEHHLPETVNIRGVLYYSVSGTVDQGESSMNVNSTYILDFLASDSIESVAARIVSQIDMCQTDAQESIRDGREYSDTLLTLDWLYSRTR